MVWEGGSWRDRAVFMKKKKNFPPFHFVFLSKTFWKIPWGTLQSMFCHAVLGNVYFQESSFKYELRTWTVFTRPDSDSGIKRQDSVSCYATVVISSLDSSCYVFTKWNCTTWTYQDTSPLLWDFTSCFHDVLLIFWLTAKWRTISSWSWDKQLFSVRKDFGTCVNLKVHFHCNTK